MPSNPLPVMEHFYTLQGEGYWTGSPAYFIRLAGCDVGCPWCDVKESWEISADQYWDPQKLIELAKSSGAPRIVITGGEPCMHNLEEITRLIHENGMKAHLETSGAYPITGKFDWICLSPKKFKPVLSENFALADELKVIAYNSHDFQWGEEQSLKCSDPKTRYYLQPEWSKRETMTPKVIEYVKDHPKWNLSLQTHKFTGIP